MDISKEYLPLFIQYDSWTDDITIENKHIRHVETRYEFENPVSSIPSSWHEVVLTDANLTDQQWSDLKQFIKDSGFETLKDAYGAPEGKRYYPYNLTIARGEERKEVQYRSNPSYDKPPEPFWAIEKYLFDLSNQARMGTSDKQPHPISQ